MIGETIGHFEITERVGRGGMGEVFAAEHKAIKTRVAVKVLHAEVSSNTNQIQRFFNEARAVARIQHAGIVRIFDVGFHTNQRAYLIMEYLEGETLAQRIERVGRLPGKTTAELARQIASVLGATHHAGIIHRDLKPENVFLVPDRELASGERVKLLDFGIAKLSDATSGVSTAGTMGTPTYMAPEQWSDSSRVDWRADAYSLGCILYKMAAGRPPFASTSIAEACAKHLHETPPTLRELVADIPGEIDALALRLLAKDPAQRIASMDELEQQLSELAGRTLTPAPSLLSNVTLPGDDHTSARHLTATTLSGAASISTSPPIAPARKPRWRKLAALGASAVVAAGIAAWRLERAPVADSEVPLIAPKPPVDAPAPVEKRVEAPELDRRAAMVAWIEAANPFVEAHGARWLAHQVTRREYGQFLKSMPGGDALRFQPVTGWNDRDPMRPVAWVTFDRAAAFCAAIHATLPTSEQWTAASEGHWGIDPGNTGALGPLQEWTQTKRDGFVVVRGGHERMSAAGRKAAASDLLLKSSEADAGPSAAPNVIAAETIGFRCVR